MSCFLNQPDNMPFKRNVRSFMFKVIMNVDGFMSTILVFSICLTYFLLYFFCFILIIFFYDLISSPHFSYQLYNSLFYFLSGYFKVYIKYQIIYQIIIYYITYIRMLQYISFSPSRFLCIVFHFSYTYVLTLQIHCTIFPFKQSIMF